MTNNNPTQKPRERAMRPKEAADIAEMSVRHLWRLLKSGKIKARRVEGTRIVRIYASDNPQLFPSN